MDVHESENKASRKNNKYQVKKILDPRIFFSLLQALK